jgi:hypothetical protein
MTTESIRAINIRSQARGSLRCPCVLHHLPLPQVPSEEQKCHFWDYAWTKTEYFSKLSYRHGKIKARMIHARNRSFASLQQQRQAQKAQIPSVP